MTIDFAQPNTAAKEPTRDRWGRPLIYPVGSDPLGHTGKGDADKPVPYTRVSTLAKMIDDTTNLTKWKSRMVAHGIGKREDLVMLARALDPEADKRKLDDLCEQAMMAAGSGQAANRGTALHTFLEWADAPRADRDEVIVSVPVDVRSHVAAYIQARDESDLHAIGMERFVVCDELQAAGSFDRLYVHPTFGLVVGDIKTGSSAAAFPHSTAMQIATYAHSVLYDVETGTRTPIPGINLEVGVLIHLDQKTAECNVYALDIARGWKAAQLATEVHTWRKAKNIAKEWPA